MQTITTENFFAIKIDDFVDIFFKKDINEQKHPISCDGFDSKDEFDSDRLIGCFESIYESELNEIIGYFKEW